MSDDYAANTSTTGTVTVGGSATGVIEKRGDVDWFAVELVAGKTYVIDLEGAGAGSGTLGDGMLYGLFDDEGARVARRKRDGGEGEDARLVFTATESGTHYIAASGQKQTTGTYTVRVQEQGAPVQQPTQQQTSQQQQTPPADADATAAGATDLGAIGGRWSSREGSVDGGDDGTDYYSFTLSERKAVTLSLRDQDADADLYLEDGNGAVLTSGTEDGTAKETVTATLDAGTYYVRVVAQEAGDNAYRLLARAKDPAPGQQPTSPPPNNPGSQQPPQTPGSQQQNSGQQQTPVDTDATRTGTTVTVLDELGSFGGWDTTYVASRKGSVDGAGDVTDYYSFTIWHAQKVEFKLVRQDANADLYLESADGTVLDSSTKSDTKNEKVAAARLDPGTYYVRVAAQEEGENNYQLNYTFTWAETPGQPRVDPIIEALTREPPDDYTADTSTTGSVAVGGSVTGRYEEADDVDWFAVELEAGKTYRFDVTGALRKGFAQPNGLVGLYDGDGNGAPGLKFASGRFLYYTPTEAGTYYAAVGKVAYDKYVFGTLTGDYTLSVAEVADDYAAGTDTTGTVAVGGSTWGNIESWDDRDWLKVELEAGETYHIELHGGRKLNGYSEDGMQTGPRATLWDYHMRGAVYDEDGNRLGSDAFGHGGMDARWHDSPDAGWCPPRWLNKVQFTPTESGTYYVEVDTGPTPFRPTDPNGVVEDHVEWVLLEDGRYWLKSTGEVRDTRPAPADAIGTYMVTVTKTGGDDYAAGTGTTGAVTVGGEATGKIDYRSDSDWFAVTLEAGKTYEITRSGIEGGTLKTSLILGAVLDDEGELVSGTECLAGEATEPKRFTPDEDGTYYVSVSSWSSPPDPGELGAYTLSVDQVDAM